MSLQPVSNLAPRFQRIDDVEQACRLREAGLLWRYTGIARYFLDGDTWEPESIRGLWVDARRHGSFDILLED